MKHNRFLVIVLLSCAITPVLAQIRSDSIVTLRPDTVDRALLKKTLYESDIRDNRGHTDDH